MKIEDYAKADCSLFRLPTIDTSSVEKIIQLALVDAWKRGTSVDTAIDSVLSDNNVVQKLVDQVADNIEFQRSVALRTVEANNEKLLRSYEEERKTKLLEVENVFAYEINDKQTALEQTTRKLDEEGATYSAAQRSLDEMRTRLQEKLKKLGGKEGFKSLMNINDLVTGKKEVLYGAQEDEHPTDEAKSDTESHSYSYRSRSKQVYVAKTGISKPVSVEKALELATAKYSIDPLKGKTLDSVVDDSKRGKSNQFWSKVWKVLNYKIW